MPSRDFLRFCGGEGGRPSPPVKDQWMTSRRSSVGGSGSSADLHDPQPDRLYSACDALYLMQRAAHASDSGSRGRGPSCAGTSTPTSSRRSRGWRCSAPSPPPPLTGECAKRGGSTWSCCYPYGPPRRPRSSRGLAHVLLRSTERELLVVLGRR